MLEVVKNRYHWADDDNCVLEFIRYQDPQMVAISVTEETKALKVQTLFYVRDMTQINEIIGTLMSVRDLVYGKTPPANVERICACGVPVVVGADEENAVCAICRSAQAIA